MSSEKTYRYDLDLLKGLAIIAVMLYHAGWCKSGYLGVDVFFVLNGYFVVPKVTQELDNGQFHYWRFLEKKLFRLLPLVLLVSACSLAVGFWGMLPGDYRYLSEEVVASSVFMNNILQAVTTQNYWAAIYHKILMHNWFLGVLFQFYIIFPLLMMVLKKRMKGTLVILTILSLLLYLSPIDTVGNKYYLLPYRFFELSIGGLMAFKLSRTSSAIGYVSFIGILFMIFFGAFTIGERVMPYNLVGGTNTIRESFMPRELILILTVLFTVMFLIGNKTILLGPQRSRVLVPLGRMSLSIFLWHQPFFAFYRYFFADELSLSVLLLLVGITIMLSLITYYYIERCFTIGKVSRISLIVAFLIVNAFALWVYHQGGAVRDVPELDIRKGSYDPETFERYTDCICQYDREFDSDSAKQRVLIVGNSFARDFANILLESSFSDSIQLSYHVGIDDCPLSRIRQCDRIYFFGWKHQVPAIVWQNLKAGAEVWGIGTKNHGTSNGIFYKNRHHSDYFSQTTPINPDYFTVNLLLKEEWQDRYIDLLNFTLLPDSTVPVFTPDHHFITYDGMHLTPSGTRYYSRLFILIVN